jgi:hypothetical protein
MFIAVTVVAACRRLRCEGRRARASKHRLGGRGVRAARPEPRDHPWMLEADIDSILEADIDSVVEV